MYGLYFRSSAFSSYKQRKTSKRFSLNETVIGVRRLPSGLRPEIKGGKHTDAPGKSDKLPGRALWRIGYLYGSAPHFAYPSILYESITDRSLQKKFRGAFFSLSGNATFSAYSSICRISPFFVFTRRDFSPRTAHIQSYDLCEIRHGYSYYTPPPKKQRSGYFLIHSGSLKFLSSVYCVLPKIKHNI